MKKILIFSWRGPGHPNAGGAEIVTHQHAKYWAKKGYQVTLFTSAYIGGKKIESIDGVKIIRDGNQILSVQLAALKWYLFKNKEKHDLVIDQFHGLPFFTPLYVKAPTLAFIHEVAKEIWSLNHLKYPLNILFGAAGRMIEPWIFKIFYKNNIFLTVSNSTKQDLSEWGIAKKNIKVIENGIDRPKVKPSIKTGPGIVTFFGALSRDKGIETAIKVFSHLSEKDPGLKFWVIGKGQADYLKQIKDLAKSLKVLDKVKFWGYVTETKKYQLLSKSSLLINPSIREGWGLTVIEAASVGTPTVAFDVAGLRDSIQDKKTGIIVKQESPQAMSQAVQSLLENKIKLQTLSKQALIWSKNFSWQKSCKESLKFVNELI